MLSGLLTGLGFGVDRPGGTTTGASSPCSTSPPSAISTPSNGEVTEFAQYLKATPPAKGFTEVLYPGEIEFRREQDRRKNGIPVEDATWKKLQDLAQGYGIADKLGL